MGHRLFARWTVNIETNIVLYVEFVGDSLVTYLITLRPDSSAH